MGRLTAVTVSVIAGIVAGAVSGKLMDTWTWPLGIALGVSAVALIVTQLWLSKKDDDGRSSTGASGTGTIAVGGSVKRDIDSEIDDVGGGGTPAPAQDGVQASGTGSIAIGKNVKGGIRNRVRRREGGP
jgi:membrane protein implicated in regulation of membrane protease activity